MTCSLIIHDAHPGITVQDLGRPGYLSFGLSRGGAMDRLAIIEGAALLGQPDTLAALEMAGRGGVFEATEDVRIALTGAPMRASLDDTKLVWGASHALPKGARLSIGAVTEGTYGYLHIGGGFDTPLELGARGAHLAAGIGTRIQGGQRLPVGPDVSGETGLRVAVDARFTGGTIHIVPSLQTEFFPEAEIERFQATAFRRDARGNRMGVPLLQDGAHFQSAAGLSVVSEVVVPGDIQITGDGTPFVLLAECQTTGGYPRIGSVLPTDLPRVAQAPPGTTLQFRFVSLDEAVAIETRERKRRMDLRKSITPLIRRPDTIPDLLSYNLISGVIAGDSPS
ncbi:MAG: biotin-dependent carboxyltransferase family protein [Pseudomonadota bacterium]